MPETKVRWLLDVGLPRVGPNGHTLDILHAEDLDRRPGHVGVAEATLLGRALVTVDHGFRGAWHVPVPHPGIVILEGGPVSGQEVVRNLTHLLFCLHRRDPDPDTCGQRYVIQVDRAILRVLPDGSEQDVETWKQPHVLASPSVIERSGLQQAPSWQ